MVHGRIFFLIFLAILVMLPRIGEKLVSFSPSRSCKFVKTRARLCRARLSFYDLKRTSCKRGLIPRAQPSAFSLDINALGDRL
ncbi:hypothetical protein [Capybara microvirus Cap1_SP_192]|nr:hypothetical protein [Capybara microvirus Cap1_SP_192]